MRGPVARRAFALALFHVACVAGHVRAETSFVAGPWLMDARPGSVVVAVETRSPVPVVVDVTVGHDGAPLTFESAPASRHFVRLSPLPEATIVRYRVRAPGHAEVAGTYRTPPPASADAVEFFAYGDSRDGDAVHAEILREMAKRPGDFVVHLGDMVPTGGSDREWSDFFAITSPLLRDRPLVPVLGNHEIAAGDAARSRYFAHVRTSAPEGSAFHAFDWGPVRILALDSNVAIAAGSPQHRFVAHELARAHREATPRALVVALHHGPFSSGHHGDLVPLVDSGLLGPMRRAGVRLVLSGHDHDYERGDVNGLRYVVSGGGGSPLYTQNRRRSGQLAFSPEHHFLHVRFAHDELEIDAIRPDGSYLERCRAGTRGAWRCGASGDARGPVGGETPLRFFLRHRIRRIALGCLLAAALAVAFEALRRRSKKP